MNKRQEEIIGHALDHPEPLTTWEYDFIDNMAEVEYDLTEKQNNVLERIAGKVGI